MHAQVFACSAFAVHANKRVLTCSFNVSTIAHGNVHSATLVHGEVLHSMHADQPAAALPRVPNWRMQSNRLMLQQAQEDLRCYGSVNTDALTC